MIVPVPPPLHVSWGNKKIGRTMNISLPPIITCEPDPPCAVKCYAKSSYNNYPQTHTAWLDNYLLWKGWPDIFERKLNEAIRKRKTNWFRWHVGGDIPDPLYFTMMERVAETYFNVYFLCFTRKGYRSNIKNLTIIRSHWIGEELNHQDQAQAMVLDRHQLPPKDAFHCPGECETCRKCWCLEAGETVAFTLHGNGYRSAHGKR